MTTLPNLLVLAALIGLAANVLYPGILMVMYCLGFGLRRSHRRKVAVLPSVSMIIPVHDGALPSLPKKLKNVSDSDYDPELLEIVVAGDGNLPILEKLIDSAAIDCRVSFVTTGKRVGKNQALNKAVQASDGDILVISDVDALLDRNAVKMLVANFAEPNVGGAGGVLRIVEASDDRLDLGFIQKLYWRYERLIKTLEMKVLGSVTSNQGPIMAIRRSVFRPIPDGVVDDLFLALLVVAQGNDYIAEPEALAYLNPPSANMSAEVSRRRRIVTRSLASMWENRSIFMSGRKLPYIFCFFIHKMLRRFTPFLLTIVYAASLALAPSEGVWPYFLMLQSIGYLLAYMAYSGVLKFRLLTPGAYFWAVNQGMFLGVVDFFRGRRVSVWN